MYFKESEKFITVLTFTFAHEGAIIKGRLESEGIPCFMRDELTAQVAPFYSNAIGGVKLQVRESDLNQAIEILKETGYIKDDGWHPSKESLLPDKQAGEQQITKKGIEITCPNCGSEEVVKRKKAGWFFLLTSLLLLPFCGLFSPFFHTIYYCLDCKHEFKRIK
jgi:DNA-directed RNA polymerase subunit RPC12/RpoP